MAKAQCKSAYPLLDTLRKNCLRIGGITMENKKDIRFYKTKERIITAMIQLLKEKNFEQITVKNICESAEISRSGFYLHYLDKYDLVEKNQIELIHYVNNLLQDIPKTHATKNTIMLDMLNYLKTDGQLLALLISKHGSTEIQEQIKNLIKENALKNTISNIKIKIDSEVEKHYFIAFFSNALFGVLQEWINNGQKETPEYIVNLMNRVIKIDLV